MKKLIWRIDFTRWAACFLDVSHAWAWKLSKDVCEFYISEGIGPREAADIEVENLELD